MRELTKNVESFSIQIGQEKAVPHLLPHIKVNLKGVM